MSSAVKPAPSGKPGTAATGTISKSSSTTTSSSMSKPNAWNKPLQSTKQQKGVPKGATTTLTKGPPPGLSKQQQEQLPSSSSVDANHLVALRERFLHVLLTLTGQKVSVTLRSGTQLSGILHTATPFSHLPEAQRHKYVLKAVRVEKSSGAEDALTVKPGSTVMLDIKQVVQLHIKSCRLDALVSQQQQKDAFTDTEISNVNAAGNASKELKRAHAAWTEAGDAPTTTTTTRGPFNSRAAALAGNQTATSSSGGALKGSIAGWDQFKANEEMFNVKATFDETMYTTPLDHSQISESEKIKAEKLAREIESTATTNIHLAEERGQITNQDYDEEDRYSGVLKTDVAATPSTKLAETITTTSKSKPKLNYAKAAAAIKTPTTATIPEKEQPPAEAVPTTSPKEEPVVSERKSKEEKETQTKVQNASEEKSDGKPEKEANKEADTGKDKETTAENASEKEEEEKPKSKLNANAKEFSLNVNAPTFTPGGPSSQGPPPPPPPPLMPHQYMDPNAVIPIHMMPHPGMQPGMIPPMMPGQYPGLRYPGPFPGMEQYPQHYYQQMQQQQQQSGPPTSATTSETSGATSPVPVSDEGSSVYQQPAQEGEGEGQSSSAAVPQQPLPQVPPPPPPQIPQPFQVPGPYMQQGYYGPMPPQHFTQQFMHPHIAAQFPRPMYPMQPGMTMRGPPYYPGPNGPVPYTQYGEFDDSMNYGGRGGRGVRGGRGRGRTGRSGRGRGGRQFNQQYSSGGSQPDSGRQTPQDQSQSPQPDGFAQNTETDTSPPTSEVAGESAVAANIPAEEPPKEQK